MIDGHLVVSFFVSPGASFGLCHDGLQRLGFDLHVYLNQQRYDTARRTLEAAIKLAPDLSVAHERLGYCLWREQHYDEALNSYRTAVKLDSRNSRAHAGLGVVLMTQYLKDPSQTARRDEAIECWHRSLEIDAQQPRLRELIAKYRVRAEQPILDIEP